MPRSIRTTLRTQQKQQQQRQQQDVDQQQQQQARNYDNDNDISEIKRKSSGLLVVAPSQPQQPTMTASNTTTNTNNNGKDTTEGLSPMFSIHLTDNETSTLKSRYHSRASAKRSAISSMYSSSNNNNTNSNTTTTTTTTATTTTITATVDADVIDNNNNNYYDNDLQNGIVDTIVAPAIPLPYDNGNRLVRVESNGSHNTTTSSISPSKPTSLFQRTSSLVQQHQHLLDQSMNSCRSLLSNSTNHSITSTTTNNSNSVSIPTANGGYGVGAQYRKKIKQQQQQQQLQQLPLQRRGSNGSTTSSIGGNSPDKYHNGYSSSSNSGSNANTAITALYGKALIMLPFYLRLVFLFIVFNFMWIILFWNRFASSNSTRTGTMSPGSPINAIGNNNNNLLGTTTTTTTTTTNNNNNNNNINPSRIDLNRVEFVNSNNNNGNNKFHHFESDHYETVAILKQTANDAITGLDNHHIDTPDRTVVTLQQQDTFDQQDNGGLQQLDTKQQKQKTLLQYDTNNHQEQRYNTSINAAANKMVTGQQLDQQHVDNPQEELRKFEDRFKVTHGDWYNKQQQQQQQYQNQNQNQQQPLSNIDNQGFNSNPIMNFHSNTNNNNIRGKSRTSSADTNNNNNNNNQNTIKYYGTTNHDSTKLLEDGDDNILLVIMSNRLDGIIPSIGSIIKHASKKVDVVLVGDHSINTRVYEHFGTRINTFVSMTIDDVTADLQKNNIRPIWTWPEWHTSITDPHWKNENTIHVADWDNLMTHAHELNHLRFYIPDLSIFQNKKYLYFIDDDIIVQKDLGPVGDEILSSLSSDKGIVTPCNIWRWDSKCQNFNFHDQTDVILSSPSLYGDVNTCETNYEQHCYPKSYVQFIKDVLPENGYKQKVWNFGFTLIALQNWRMNQLTDRYVTVMKKSYESHVFPETSLTFGLGTSYLAFAGAVECWDESKIIVRDGLGFIDYDRFQLSFGSDFFTKIDVAHYTGPEKPWVPYTKVDAAAIQPWLQIMKEENLPLPEQYPTEPTTNIFIIVASDRTGVQWIMDTLDNHPDICASGETKKPESGFMADALLPSGLNWYPECSIKLGCSISFIIDKINELNKDTTFDYSTRQQIPRRCISTYDIKKDQYKDHLVRLCNFYKLLNGNYTNAAIGRIWVEAFVKEDRDLVGCKCPRGTLAKGLKIQPEWLTYQNFPDKYTGPPKLEFNSDTLIHGTKMIRLKRRNLWARYKSMALAKHSGMYHIQSAEEKQNQIRTTNKIQIPIEELVWTINHMMNIDNFGDTWVKEHASDVLYIDYEDCRDNTTKCFTKIFTFININTTFPQSMISNKKFDSLFANLHYLDESLDNIENIEPVKEALIANGWGHYVGIDSYEEIQLFVYDPINTLAKPHKVPGINITVYGGPSSSSSYGGQSKFTSILPYLRTMPSSTLIVLSDGRDYMINYPNGADNLRYDAITKFRNNFIDIETKYPKAIIVSSESTCCSSALTHVTPGSLFDMYGNRGIHSCLSGTNDCQWFDDNKANLWKSFMKDLAKQRGQRNYGNIYLDGGLLGGRAGDLLQLITDIQIQDTEDDRAVLTDFMYRYPNRIVLDYKGILFGKSFNDPITPRDDHCNSIHQPSTDYKLYTPLVSTETALFIRQQRFSSCEPRIKSSSQIQQYPSWGKEGIKLRPILEHIGRVLKGNTIMQSSSSSSNTINVGHGSEIPYFIDETGVYASGIIRNRTSLEIQQVRVQTTEALFKLALRLVKKIQNGSERSRFQNILKVVESGIGFPFWTWYGDYRSCNLNNYRYESIPLLTVAASSHCDYTFPIPNYMTIIDAQNDNEKWAESFHTFTTKYPWNHKKLKAVWRGSLEVDNIQDVYTNIRWRLCQKVYELKSDDQYDVGMTSISKHVTDVTTVNTDSIGGLVSTITPLAELMNYQIIIDVDGLSWSPRFGSLLCFNSVIIKVEPQYSEYYFSDLIPWTHYIPVKYDLSDLHEKVLWALDYNNERYVQDIVYSANMFCSQRLTSSNLAYDILDIWESYITMLNRADPHWLTQWEKIKPKLYASGSIANMMLV